jgi:hypothetical protein
MATNKPYSLLRAQSETKILASSFSARTGYFTFFTFSQRKVFADFKTASVT